MKKSGFMKYVTPLIFIQKKLPGGENMHSEYWMVLGLFTLLVLLAGLTTAILHQQPQDKDNLSSQVEVRKNMICVSLALFLCFAFVGPAVLSSFRLLNNQPVNWDYMALVKFWGITIVVDILLIFLGSKPISKLAKK